ncbi:MAG: hypothetical protein LAT62_11060 [Natronospirillum sp.]|uniref:hypothetical protein n=1 Tax=Natronospirillum sp. TaxID=2812955 RepID=UPI0025EF4703|nr:hypothetical protein [Natronospirillum sp.]MCH8552468.1 hypothetical protein [Natronospirillum sp.]
MTEPDNTQRYPAPYILRVLAVGFALLVLIGGLLWQADTLSRWLGHNRVVVTVDDSQYEVTQRQWRQAVELARRASPDGEQIYTLPELNNLEYRIDQWISEVMTLPRSRVEDTADWYFSLGAQTGRQFWSVGEWMGFDVADRPEEALKARLFPEPQWTEFNEEHSSDLLGQLNGLSQGQVNRRLDTFLQALAPYEVERPVAGQSIRLDLDTEAAQVLEHLLDTDFHRGQAAVSVASGTLTTLAARRVALYAGARASSRGATVVVSPLATACGPGAAVCLGGIWTASFVATEWALLRLDEHNNRDTFEAVLHEELDRLEQTFSQTLKDDIAVLLQTEFNAQHERFNEQVRPVDAMFDRR